MNIFTENTNTPFIYKDVTKSIGKDLKKTLKKKLK